MSRGARLWAHRQKGSVAGRRSRLRVQSDASDRHRDAGSTDSVIVTYRAQQDNISVATSASPVWANLLYVKRAGSWVNVLYQHTPAGAAPKTRASRR